MHKDYYPSLAVVASEASKYGSQTSANRCLYHHSNGLIVAFASLWARMRVLLLHHPPPRSSPAVGASVVVLQPEALFPAGRPPEGGILKVCTTPISPCIIHRIRGSLSGWSNWMMDTAPEGPGPVLCKCTRRSFGAKGCVG